MKKSLSKKILAMFLAVLMLVTAVPFTSFAATESELNDLNAAITAYENKMNGTVYTNMKAAYDAYIAAKETKDAYVYGNNNSADLAKATKELKATIDAMTKFEGANIEFVQPSWGTGDHASETNVQVTKQYSNNIIYVENDGFNENASDKQVTINNGYITATLYYDTAVLLYDGETAPQFPIIAKFENNKGLVAKSIVENLYPIKTVDNVADNDYFELYNDKANVTTSWQGNVNNPYYANIMGTQNSLDGKEGQGESGYYSSRLNNTGSKLYYASSVKYSKNALPNDKYSEKYNIPWYLFGTRQEWNTPSYGTIDTTGKADIYVINYKAIKDAIVELPQLKNVAMYSDENYAAMSTLMEAIDKATSFNPSSYDYAKDTATAVEKCGNDIKTIVNNVKAASNIQTSFAYSKLRTTMDNTKEIYEAGNGETGKPIFQPETWDRFEKAYKAAVEKMSNLPTTHYIDADGITAVEKELSDSFVNLSRVDVTNLKDAITAYETKMNGTIYTNMKPAYDAYIEAKEAFDAFKYGNNKTVQLDVITKKLEEATANMKEFVSPEIKFTVPTWFGLGEGNVAKQSVNVLYAEESYSNKTSACEYITWVDKEDRADIGVYYGTTVLLYDGVNTPQFPIMASGKAKVSYFSPLDFTNLFPAEAKEFDAAKQKDNADFRLSTTSIGGKLKDDQVWIGGRSGGNSDYDYNLTQGNGTEYVKGCFYDGNNQNKNYYAENMNTQQGVWYFSSSLKFKNTMQPTEYTKDVVIPWVAETAVGISNESKYGAMNANKHIYVVNYEAVKNAIADAAKLTQIKDVATYSDENYKAMSDLMGAIDKATSFDPNSFDYATDTAAAIEQCNAAIKEIVEGIKAGSDIKVANTYKKLRDTISLAKGTYEMGNGTPENPTFTQESWTRFENAYKAAVSEMNGLPDNHYKDAGIVELEKELTEARENLKSFKQASFEVYNYAVKNLVDKVAQGKWTAKSLEQLESELKTKKYIDKANQVNVPITEQPSINAETKEIENAEKLLKAADDSVFEAMKVNIKTINADSNNVAQIQQEFDKLAANTTKKVTILGVEYDGYIYDEIVSGTITKINETKYDYTIKVVDEANNTTKYVVMDAESKAISYTEDEKQATKFHYDDKLTLTNDVACDWAATVVAQSTATESTRKVVNTNSTSYEFSVRGNTTVYLSAATSSSSHKVTFVDSRSNEVVAFGYTSNGTFDISSVNVPNYAYYDIKGYECSTESVKIEGTQITGITSDITVTVNYAPSESVGEYTVRFEDAFGAVLETKTVKFNELVTLTKDGAKYFTDKATGKVLWTGDTYSFYACQNITVVAHADDKALETVDVSVSNAPIVSNGVTRFVGSFAQVPSRYKVLNYGVVVDFDNRYANDLSLAKVNKAEKVYNLSASSYDAKSNQFVVGVTGTYTNINYVSYVICEDTTTGYSQIFYSNIVHA